MSVNKVNQSTGELSPISGGTLYADAPVGSIQAYGGTTAPWGWLLCQGQAISRATYAELFNVIGTSFGSGDGSTTFNVPDLRGEFLRGAGTNSHNNQGSGGSVGQHQDATAVPFVSGRDNGTQIITEITVPANNESIRSVVLNSDGDFKRTTNSIFGAYSVARSNTNGNQEQYVRPTNTSVNFIIKATSIALPSDFEAAVDDKIAGVVKYGTTTGTSTASGNVVASTSLPVSSMTIISAWCETQGMLVIPSNNSGNWSFHVCYWGADMQAASNQSLTIGYAYIDK